MSVEVRPLNVLCNIQCHYCYQHPQRDAGNISGLYDLDKVKAAIKKEGKAFTLFGGEPLLLPVEDIETLWSLGYEQYGRNSIQTNGSLINDEHIRLFRTYKVTVGISMDGPDELNDIRWNGTLERTRETTRKSQEAIERLCAEKLYPSLIITLHRANASEERLGQLTAWVRDLAAKGVKSCRLHLLESENEVIRERYGLSTRENIKALLAFLELSRELPETKIHPFLDMRRLLSGTDAKSCVWNGCDSYNTSAVRGIEGHGQRSNCGRTNKDGVDYVKPEDFGFIRYLSLYHTPQQFGGCKDCRFFLMCKGQCPGTGISGDWRNRTEHCEVWKALYAVLEREFESERKVPLSKSPERVALERAALDIWSRGENVSMAKLLVPPAVLNA